MDNFPFTPIAIGHRQDYQALLGIFHSNWSAIDLHTDLAICQFLHVTAGQAHLITSGMMWGRKARLLVDLIGHSDDPRKQKLLTALNTIRAAKRDVIAHSYVSSDETTITFLEKNTSGKFKVKEHTFTMQQFKDHAVKIHEAALTFSEALGVSQQEVNDFVQAAFNLSRNEATSPVAPIDNR